VKSPKLATSSKWILVKLKLLLEAERLKSYFFWYPLEHVASNLVVDLIFINKIKFNRLQNQPISVNMGLSRISQTEFVAESARAKI